MLKLHLSLSFFFVLSLQNKFGTNVTVHYELKCSHPGPWDYRFELWEMDLLTPNDHVATISKAVNHSGWEIGSFSGKLWDDGLAIIDYDDEFELKLKLFHTCGSRKREYTRRIDGSERGKKCIAYHVRCNYETKLIL